MNPKNFRLLFYWALFCWQFLAVPALAAPSESAPISCPDFQEAVETSAGWSCACVSGYADDGDGQCSIVDCQADHSSEGCSDSGGNGGNGGNGGGGGPGSSCTEIMRHCPSYLIEAGVWAGTVGTIGACVFTLGWACAALPGELVILTDITIDLANCRKELREAGCGPIRRMAPGVQTEEAMISGILARLSNEERFPRSGLSAGIPMSLTVLRSPDGVPNWTSRHTSDLIRIMEQNITTVGGLSRQKRGQLDRLHRDGLQRLNHLSTQRRNDEITVDEYRQQVDLTNREMDQKMVQILGREGKEQYTQMMATYARGFLSLHGISYKLE